MCDLLVALGPATASGTTLFAKNSDRPPGEPQDLAWHPGRRDEGPLAVTHIAIEPHPTSTFGCLLSRPRWCWGAEHGVNEAGVACGNATIYTTLDPRPFPDALVGMDLVRLVLERAATAADGVSTIVDLLERYGQGGSGHDPGGSRRPYWSSFLVADPGDAWVVETSGREWAAQQVHDAWAISNRTTIPAFDAAYRHPGQPVERYVDPRWHASQAVLARRPVTVEALVAHLGSHEPCGDEGWSVCMHTDVQVTTASMVAELPVGAAPRVLVAPGSPCSHSFAPAGLGPAVRVPGGIGHSGGGAG